MKKNLSFDDLLKKGKSMNIYQINLKILTTEICKVTNDLEPQIKKDIISLCTETIQSEK